MKKFILLFLLAKISFGAGLANADDCGSDPFPSTTKVYYTKAGKLAQIDDTLHRSTARFFWDSPLMSISETEFKMDLPKPDKHGDTERWGPRRSLDYNAKTGALSAIHTYEDTHYNKKGVLYGYQTSYYNLEGVDFSKFKDKSGLIQYKGPAVHETVEYDQTPLGDRTVTVKDPLNIKETQCYTFEGTKFPLNRPTAKVAPSKVADESKEKPAPAPAPANKGGDQKICIQGGCITIHGDDGSASDDDNQSNDEQDTQ